MNDFDNGAGLSSETYTWRYSGSGTATPDVVSKDNKVDVSFVYGTQISGLVVGSIIVTSNDPGAQFPVSMNLNDFALPDSDIEVICQLWISLFIYFAIDVLLLLKVIVSEVQFSDFVVVVFMSCSFF